jgi:hypothetical protein
VRALDTTEVTAEEVGFAGARQIGKLRTRVRGCGRRVKETRYLITSASPEQLDTKRGYWAIEAKLHHRLDEVLQEDKSRVRTGSAGCILGMCRRAGRQLCVRLAAARERWAEAQSQKHTQFSGASRSSRRRPRLRPRRRRQPHRMASKLEEISPKRPKTPSSFSLLPAQVPGNLIVRGSLIGQVGVAAMLPPAANVSPTINLRLRLTAGSSRRMGAWGAGRTAGVLCL